MRYALIALTSLVFSLTFGPLFPGLAQQVETTAYASSPDSLTKTFGLIIHVSPGENDVQAILDLLRSYHMHATFLLDQGWAKQNGHLIKEIMLEGHEIKYEYKSINPDHKPK